VTQFEALTAAAYHELARRGVEVAVIEAGLGGRFDATNVIPSKVQVLTTVGLEHTRWLGPTLADIAAEKLAVVRDHGTLVVGELEPELLAVARQTAVEHESRLVEPAADLGVALRAPGRFQRRNFALAAAAAGAFLGRPLDQHAVETAGAEIRIPGRLDAVAERPLTVYDGAHNPEGARALAESLDEVLGDHRPRAAVIGVLEDKDAAGMLNALLPHVDSAIFTRSSNPRSLPPATLATLAEKITDATVLRAETVSDPRAAVERARVIAGPGGAVLATGSIYLVADLVREYRSARASTL
jgi:dihydrofolate synthase / folylpolyglutamate synthase